MDTKNIKIDKSTYDVIRMRIVHEERKNAKSHELSDGKMVDNIVNIIKQEVNRLPEEE